MARWLVGSQSDQPPVPVQASSHPASQPTIFGAVATGGCFVAESISGTRSCILSPLQPASLTLVRARALRLRRHALHRDVVAVDSGEQPGGVAILHAHVEANPVDAHCDRKLSLGYERFPGRGSQGALGHTSAPYDACVRICVTSPIGLVASKAAAMSIVSPAVPPTQQAPPAMTTEPLTGRKAADRRINGT